MAHIAESQHWYHLDGSPCYEVEAAKGGMRPATLRDARKLNLVPSVTGIIRCAAAPGLERWKQQQVLHAALTLPLVQGESEDDYLTRIMQDSREQAKKASELGTAIHAAIQSCYDMQSYDKQYDPHVCGVVDAVDKWLPVAGWGAERSFAHPMGFGGKTDLSCDDVVIDFKTKEFGPESKLDTWDEHAMQLAAYREGLGMRAARCAIVYVSVTAPGLTRVIEISKEDLDLGWMMFKGLFSYWCAKNHYWPAKEMVAA